MSAHDNCLALGTYATSILPMAARMRNVVAAFKSGESTLNFYRSWLNSDWI